jgi:hypothetical protein
VNEIVEPGDLIEQLAGKIAHRAVLQTSADAKKFNSAIADGGAGFKPAPTASTQLE